MFSLFLDLGFEHITDFNGYDHILFIVALASVYDLKSWRKILILITAFTIGHSVTLALATLNIIRIPSEIIEFLIPVTILIVALFDLLSFRMVSERIHRLKYMTAVFFGLIHGLGFSNYLRNLLGNEDSIVNPLLAFNIGLEIGQIIIVAGFLILTSLLYYVFHLQKKYVIILTSVSIALVSIYLIIDRIPA